MINLFLQTILENPPEECEDGINGYLFNAEDAEFQYGNFRYYWEKVDSKGRPLGEAFCLEDGPVEDCVKMLSFESDIVTDENVLWISEEEYHNTIRKR